ncbi:MAG: PadR family transcriptional regulator [Bacilli bacterium]
MNTQFKKGVLELCLLNLIIEQDEYGYELVNKINIYLDVSINTIYPILRRLTNEGLLATYSIKSGDGKERKYYTITMQGQAYYEKFYLEWDSFNSQVNNLLERKEDHE